MRTGSRRFDPDRPAGRPTTADPASDAGLSVIGGGAGRLGVGEVVGGQDTGIALAAEGLVAVGTLAGASLGGVAAGLVAAVGVLGFLAVVSLLVVENLVRNGVLLRADSPGETQRGDPDGGGADPASGAELDDRDRIHRLLEDAGGRLHQTEIVERTGWSKAKASRLLSAMAEDGEIVKFRIGRENLIYLPDRVPEIATTSP